jgi:hypothetical protein
MSAFESWVEWTRVHILSRNELPKIDSYCWEAEQNENRPWAENVDRFYCGKKSEYCTEVIQELLNHCLAQCCNFWGDLSL